jgi:hypothetical protein
MSERPPGEIISTGAVRRYVWLAGERLAGRSVYGSKLASKALGRLWHVRGYRALSSQVSQGNSR